MFLWTEIGQEHAALGGLWRRGALGHSATFAGVALSYYGVIRLDAEGVELGIVSLTG
jgi:hypothetical protein